MGFFFFFGGGGDLAEAAASAASMQFTAVQVVLYIQYAIICGPTFEMVGAEGRGRCRIFEGGSGVL